MKTPRATIATGLLLIVCVVPISARAKPPDEPTRIPLETGFIEARAGIRTAPQGAFEKSLAGQGMKLESTLITPAVIALLGYRVNRNWTAGLDFSYGRGQYDVSKDGVHSALRSMTFSLQIAGQWVPSLDWDRLEPVFGIGLGYYLSTLANGDGRLEGANTEANTVGVFVSAGLRYALTRNLGLSVEDRYALAVAGVGSLGTLNVGGNTASLGLYYVWR